MKKILTIREPQAGRILGLLENVATDEGAIELHPIHVETLQAMAEHLFQASFSPGAEGGSFSEARSIVDGDDELAMQVMNMAGILPFAEEENEQRRIDAAPLSDLDMAGAGRFGERAPAEGRAGGGRPAEDPAPENSAPGDPATGESASKEAAPDGR